MTLCDGRHEWVAEVDLSLRKGIAVCLNCGAVKDEARSTEGGGGMIDPKPLTAASEALLADTERWWPGDAMADRRWALRMTLEAIEAQAAARAVAGLRELRDELSTTFPVHLKQAVDMMTKEAIGEHRYHGSDCIYRAEATVGIDAILALAGEQR